MILHLEIDLQSCNDLVTEECCICSSSYEKLLGWKRNLFPFLIVVAVELVAGGSENGVNHCFVLFGFHVFEEPAGASSNVQGL